MLKRFFALSVLLGSASLLCEKEVPKIEDHLNFPKKDILREESSHIERMKAILKYNNALKNDDLKTALDLKERYVDIELDALALAEDSDYQCKDDNQRARLVKNLEYTQKQSEIVKKQMLEQNNKLSWEQNIKANPWSFALVAASGMAVGSLGTMGYFLIKKTA